MALKPFVDRLGYIIYILYSLALCLFGNFLIWCWKILQLRQCTSRNQQVTMPCKLSRSQISPWDRTDGWFSRFKNEKSHWKSNSLYVWNIRHQELCFFNLRLQSIFLTLRQYHSLFCRALHLRFEKGMVGLSFCDFVGTREEKARMAEYRQKEWPRRFKVTFSSGW